MGTYKKAERKKYGTVDGDRYPIGDKVHAEKALQFINKGGLSPDEKETVRRKAARFGVGTAKPAEKGQKDGKESSRSARKGRREA